MPLPRVRMRFTEAHHVRHWADGGETSLRNTLLLCRRHHRAVHEGRVKVSVNRDGTVLFLTPSGRMLADAPRRPGWADSPTRRDRGHSRTQRVRTDVIEQRVGLPPVSSEHRAAQARGDGIALSNGAALYRDSEIPWEIEAAAREAMEESIG